MYNKKLSLKKFLVFIIFVCLFIFLGFVLKKFIFQNNKLDKINYYENEASSVHFIDVGQGDCELIVCNKKTVLIDAGEKDKGSVVVKYLKDCGVKKLDYIIATHPHTDHIGGLAEVMNNFEVGEIIMPKIPLKLIPTSFTYKKFLQKIKDKKIKVKQATKGEVLDFGIGRMKIIAPLRENYKNLNDFSVGGMFKCDGFSFLFCGDMEKDAEKDVLNSKEDIKADVFKLNHHGSKTSNRKHFLETVNPSYCVVEAGKNNKYNHPHNSVIKLIKKLNVKKIFQTKNDGTIVFMIKDRKLSYKTQKGRWF